MQKTLARITTAQQGWPRAVFGAVVLGLGGLAAACLEVSGGPEALAFAGATAVVIAGMAVRAWIGPVSDEDGDEDLIY